MAPAAPIAVYGATGYTGRLVAGELQRRGLDHVLCGRSREKLRALAGELGSQAQVRAAAVDDLDALRHALAGCGAVVNCAGPFTRFGERVVKAAVETGVHYLDTTGEQLYMHSVFERFHDAALAAEVAVVPAAAFDYLPGDMLCRLAASEREPLRELVVAYVAEGFGATRGTMHSALEAIRSGALEYRDGDWRRAGLAPRRAWFTFPPPVRRQAMVPYPSGEIVTVPRHTRTQRVTSLITAGSVAPLAALAPVMPFTLPALAMAMRIPLKSVIDAVIDRLPEGPSESDRAAASFTIAAVARGDDGVSSRALARGRDMYGLTAAISVHAAELLASDGYDRSGVLAPAMAFDPVEFLDHLAGHGVTYGVEAAAPEPAAA
jgi:short subunit dehydrogenase-like uncharacterized protein